MPALLARGDLHRGPIHCEPRFQKGTHVRFKCIQEQEVHAGFEAEWTRPWPASRSRAEAQAFEDRGELIGNAYSPLSLAFLLAELCGSSNSSAAPSMCPGQRLFCLPQPPGVA